MAELTRTDSASSMRRPLPRWWRYSLLAPLEQTKCQQCISGELAVHEITTCELDNNRQSPKMQHFRRGRFSAAIYRDGH